MSKNKKDGKDVKHELEQLLDHPDYQDEFERYEKAGGVAGGFTKEEFIEFFINFENLEESKIVNQRLRNRFSLMKYFFEHIAEYEEKIKILNEISHQEIECYLERTSFGLPSTVEMTNQELIFSFAMGPSGGWGYKNLAHLDAILFLKDFNRELFLVVIAHELHHVGFGRFGESISNIDLGLHESFLIGLAGEGLAMKYCNNGEGVLTNKIYSERDFLGTNKPSWEYMVKDFSNIYNRFRDVIHKISIGIIENESQLMQEFVDYWLRTKEDTIELLQTRNYYFGMEIMGLMHDYYGTEEVFKLLLDSKQFFKKYNEALIKIDRVDLTIEFN